MTEFRFGECAFDPRTRALTRVGREVALRRKAFELLALLIERRPQVVSHAELRDRIWPGTYVSYSGLAGLVAELRHALGDDRRRPRYVRTVPGVGYAFIEPAATSADEPGKPSPFSLLWRRRHFALHWGANLIGRSPECQVQIPSSGVSRRHSRIVVAGEQAVLEDLGSKNGTRVRGRRITAPTPLADGEEILLGHETVQFVAPPPGASTETEEASGSVRE